MAPKQLDCGRRHYMWVLVDPLDDFLACPLGTDDGKPKKKWGALLREDTETQHHQSTTLL